MGCLAQVLLKGRRRRRGCLRGLQPNPRSAAGPRWQIRAIVLIRRPHNRKGQRRVHRKRLVRRRQRSPRLIRPSLLNRMLSLERTSGRVENLFRCCQRRPRDKHLGLNLPPPPLVESRFDPGCCGIACQAMNHLGIGIPASRFLQTGCELWTPRASPQGVTPLWRQPVRLPCQGMKSDWILTAGWKQRGATYGGSNSRFGRPKGGFPSWFCDPQRRTRCGAMRFGWSLVRVSPLRMSQSAWNYQEMQVVTHLPCSGLLATLS